VSTDDLTTDDATSVPRPGGGAIPVIGLGTWQLTGQAGYDAVLAALQAGYRHLDTATNYGNEAEVGRAVRDSGVPRDEVFVTTKLPAAAKGEERATIEASLEKLAMDHVDLWLVHWPPDGRASPRVWEQFLVLRDEGLARHVGVSNYGTGQIDELIDATGEAPAVNQVRWAPALFDAAFLAQNRKRGVVLEGYSPFQSSDLADPTLVAIAGDHGVTPAQVVLRWHAQHGVVAIPKSATPERIAANLDVFGFELSPAEMDGLDRLGG
jgi:2,5-diketo-D-gluconate reductase A